jgi:hypothetical protein
MKLLKISIAMALCVIVVLTVKAVGVDQECQAIPPTPSDTSTCGLPTANCPGECTRTVTDCNACFAPSTATCNAPLTPVTCKQTYEKTQCVRNRVVPLWDKCDCTNVWWTATGSSKPVNQACA